MTTQRRTPPGRAAQGPRARRPAPRRPPVRRRRRLPLGHTQHRLRIAVLMLAFVLSIFVGRLVQVQGLDAPAYAAMAEKHRLHTVTLQATRGTILDRDGNQLAVSVDARAVYADPKEVTDPQAEAAALAPLLHLPVADLADKLGRSGRFVYLARGLTPDTGRAVSKLELAGIGTLPESKRIYPGGQLAANLVGFVGQDGKGLGGLELSANDLLSGKDGTLTSEFGGNGRPIPDGLHVQKDAVPGDDLTLTIDRDIQWEAQQAINAQVSATGAKSGTVVVMDPRSGQLLALATAPSFDPNHPGDADPANLGNRALSDVYEPGSTNKVITMAAALESGVATPDTPVTVPPTLQLAGHTFHDAERHGTEHLTLTGVLAKSSNIGTIEIAQQLGREKLYHFLRSFGFGRPTGLGFPGESGGILPPVDSWSGTQQYTIPFGQGVSVTALQMASVYATVANGGVRIPPNLLLGTTGPDGSFHRRAAPKPTRVISAKTAKSLRDMLETVTGDDGTAPAARIAGYRVAGKTGTSQRVNPKTGRYDGSYTASFVGFAPADNPQLVVEVVLQAPVNGHFGGTVAAPVFHDVMSFALQSRHVAPTGTKPPVLKLKLN